MLGLGKGTHLLQQSPLLDNICYCLLLDAFSLVNVLESVELLRLLVLYHSNLEGARRAREA